MDWVPGEKSLPFWFECLGFLGGQYSNGAGAYLATLAAKAVVLAVPAVILGWVLQAAVMAAWARMETRRMRQSAAVTRASNPTHPPIN